MQDGSVTIIHISGLIKQTALIGADKICVISMIVGREREHLIAL